MLAFLTNLSIGEMLVIAMIAVLVFGKNLPEVAGRVFAQVRKVRRTVEEMRRETGIDRDFDTFRRSMRDIEQEADVVDPLRHATRQPMQDTIHRLEDHQETDPALADEAEPAEGAETTPEAGASTPPLGQPMAAPSPPPDVSPTAEAGEGDASSPEKRTET